jgi:hypothetical protein
VLRKATLRKVRLSNPAFDLGTPGRDDQHHDLVLHARRARPPLPLLLVDLASLHVSKIADATVDARLTRYAGPLRVIPISGDAAVDVLPRPRCQGRMKLLEDWVFGHWLAEELAWCRKAFEAVDGPA